MDPINNFADFVKLYSPKTEFSLQQIKAVQMISDLATNPPMVIPAPGAEPDVYPVKKFSFGHKKCKPQVCVPCQEEEEVQDMNSFATAATINVADTTEKDQRKFLRCRLEDAFYSKKGDLKRKFNLIDEEAPDTLADLIERIKTGRFTADEKDLTKKSWSPLCLLRWRDPAAKEDKEGYATAKAALKKAYDKAEEDIRILAPTDGLAALRAFQDVVIG